MSPGEIAEFSAILKDLTVDSPHHISIFTSLAPTKTESQEATVDYCKFNKVVASVAAMVGLLEQIHRPQHMACAC